MVVGELVDQAGLGGAARSWPSDSTRARRAFDRERYGEAKRIVSATRCAKRRGAASVRELHGLRSTAWSAGKEAAAELEAFARPDRRDGPAPGAGRLLSGPRPYDDVDELWNELNEASPSAELMAEGRIVAAGSLADRGRLQDAIALLEKAPAAAEARP